MSVEVDKSGWDDDVSVELFENGKYDVVGWYKGWDENGSEDIDGVGS